MTKKYLQEIFGNSYSKYEELINKALENNYVVNKNSDFKAIEASFEAIYDKYLIRVLEEAPFYCTKYGLKKEIYNRYYTKLENLLWYYLNQVEQTIELYVDLFVSGMDMIALTSDREYLPIDDFLTAIFQYVETYGNINRDEAKNYFCSYFYLLNFEAKQEGEASNQYSVYVTPETSKLCTDIKVSRGIFSA